MHSTRAWVVQLTRLALLCSVGCLGLALGEARAGAATAAEAGAADAADATNQLEEVVVTARRREERGQDVPISITTFSTTRLQEQNITQAQDLQASVPSLVVGQNGQGVRDAPTFTLRGQGATFEGSPGVVMYMNEVPLPAPITLSNQGAPGNFLDLENVQILAGPQGTLFGRNTTGGAVLLVPNRPTERLEGYIQGSYGNHNDREAEGVFNVPLIAGVLKARLAVQSQDRDGFTHDINWNVNRDDTHYVTARLGVDWTPIDKLDNYTMAYFTNSHNHGPGSISEGFNVPAIVGTNAYLWGQTGGTLGCDPAVPSSPVSCAKATAYYTNLTKQAQALGPRATALDLNEFSYMRTWGVTNTTRYEITPDLTIRNIASYAAFKDGYSLDADGSTAAQYDTGVNGVSDQAPRDYFRTATEELQVQGTQLDGNLSYTLGGFYFLQEPLGYQGGDAIDYCFYNLIVFNACGSLASPSHFTETNRSKAAYAQAVYSLGQLTPVLRNLKLTLGYRYTWDQIEGNTDYYGNFSGLLKSSAPNWTAGLDYKVSDGLLVYGKASRGYKAGGFNTYAVYPNTRTFGPEFATAYELGLKSDTQLGDRPVRFNLDVYRTDYSKIQRASADFNPANNATGAVILSSAAAIIQGVELEADLKVTRDLEFGLNYGYTDAYYKKFPFTPNQTYPGYVDCNGTPWIAGNALNLKCTPLQYVAPHIFSAHLRYNLPVAATLGEISAFVNYSFESAQNTEALFPGDQQPFQKLASYSLVNLSLNWRDVYGRPVDLSFFMTNVTDRLYRTTNTDQWEALGTGSTLYGEPRMFGLRVRYHWGQ
jgi:iron complex outermembrane receptor protein